MSSEALSDSQFQPAKLPTKAHLPGVGMVRILEYHGDNRFTVLDRTDSKRLVHRDRLSFRK